MKTLQYYIEQIAKDKITELQVRKMCLYLGKKKSNEILAEASEAFIANQPQLYKSQATEMVKYLKAAFKGTSHNHKKKEHPYTLNDMFQIKNSTGAAFVGIHIEKMGTENIIRPVYAVTNKIGVKGFHFYQQGDKPVIIKR